MAGLGEGFSLNDLIMYVEYTGNNPLYIGYASPGTAVSEEGWMIKKFTYDGSGNVLTALFASGTGEFDKEWDERTSYSYS